MLNSTSIFVALLLRIIWGVVGEKIAKRRGFNEAIGFLTGLLLDWSGVVILCIYPEEKKDECEIKVSAE